MVSHCHHRLMTLTVAGTNWAPNTAIVYACRCGCFSSVCATFSEKVSRPPVADRSALRIGASVVVEWDGDWYKAKIIDTDAKNVKIRYKVRDSGVLSSVLWLGREAIHGNLCCDQGGSAGEDEWIFWQSRRLSLPLPDDDPSDTERKHRNKRPAKRRRSKQPSDEGGMEGKPVLECAAAPQALTGPAKVIVQWDDGHKYVASVKKREGDKLFVHYQVCSDMYRLERNEMRCFL
jgi:hypothetical protein